MNTMDLNAQVYRTDQSLTQAEEDIAVLKERYAKVAISGKGKRYNSDLLEAIATSRAAATSGRTTRTAMTRIFMRHTLAYRDNDGSVRLDYKPVSMTRYRPMERKY